jgi:hypothetical protein
MSNFSDVQLSIDDVIKTFIQPIPANTPPFDAVVKKLCNEKLNVVLRGHLNKAILPGGQLPVNRMAHVVSTFLESMDFDSVYAHPVLVDLLPKSEELAPEAEVALDTVLKSTIEELTSMGPMGIGILTEKIHSYVAAYIREKKYENVYSLGTFTDRLKAADENTQLLSGAVLPPGFSDVILNEVSEKVGAVFRSWPKVGTKNLR